MSDRIRLKERMHVITKTAELTGVCERLRKERYVTVDTEFLRDNTYWPKLCLIQAAGASDQVLIDPLADGLDLTPFFDLLRDESVLKVFHAARQDLEIFHQMAGVIPSPLFDTQVAGMVCGFGESVGYETLVNTLAGAQIDKSSRFTDWSKRPLSPKQLAYALADVTHLRVIFEALEARLKENNRSHWLEEEMRVLQAPATYTAHPEDAWKRLKLRNTKPRFVALLQAVAAWREEEAQSADKPRNRILKDDVIYEIAAQAPGDEKALEDLRGIPKGFTKSKPGKRLVKVIKTALDLPKDDLPRLKKDKPLPSGLGPVIDLLRVLLKTKCEEHGVAQKLVASSSDLEQIAAADEAPVPALSGWRRELFGEDALKLKHGKLALGLKGKRVEVIGEEGA